MGFREKLRRPFASRLRPQAAAPAPAPAPVAASATALPALTTTPSASSAPAAPLVSAPPASPPCAPASLTSSATASLPSSALIKPMFPVMRLVDKASSSMPSSPRRVFVSLSSDLRLVDVMPTGIAPTSLDDFRRPGLKFSLGRLTDVPLPGGASTQSLESAVNSHVCAEEHADGPAVRVSDCSKRAILLITDTADERDGFLMSLRLRVAPWSILRVCMKEEMAATASSSSPLVRAMREVLAGTKGARTAEKNVRTDGLVMKAWDKAGTVPEPSIWTATFAQGIASVAMTAEEVERLAKLLGGMSIVGCVFTLVALSARVVGLFTLEKEGRPELAKARDDLREASLLLVRWLFSILSSGFQDTDELIDRVFDILVDCWRYGNQLEQYLLQGRIRRVWKAEDVSIILAKTGAVRANLLGAGLLKNFAGLKNEVEVLHGQFEVDQGLNEKRFDILESKSRLADSFSPRFPDPAVFSTSLVRDAAVQLARLKEAVSHSSENSGAHEFSSSTRCVALTSVDGEGGVGKTSTCKLLCVDPEIRKRFDEGAIIWIEVGKDASVEVVKEKLAIAVEDCGGALSSQRIRESKIAGIGAAVAIARLYFSKHQIMLVLDNVWHPRFNIGVKSWAAELTQIASFQGSVVIMTTRFEKLAESPGFERVRVGAYDLISAESSDWHLAENLYDFLLKDSAEKRASSVYVSNRREALIQSCGIPLAIATFAGLVRDLRKVGHDADEVLSRIKRRSLGLTHKFVGEEQEFTVGHHGLFAAMEESLISLDERKARRIKLKPLALRSDRDGRDCRVWNAAYGDFLDKALSSRYASLHMLPESSPTASLPVLSELWQVTGIEEAERIAFDFVDIGLARWQGAGGNVGLVLHDLQYEFCGLFSGMSSAGQFSTCFHVAVDGHALFLSSCESLLPSEKVGDNTSMWGQFCFNQSLSSIDDHKVLREYLANNLLRHFCSAAPDHLVDFAKNCTGIRSASMREIMLVLSNFSWLRGRFYSQGGRSAVLRDFAGALDAGFLCDSDTNSLRRLLKSVMLVSDDASCHLGGTLASSLVQTAQSVEAQSPPSDSASDTAFLKNLSIEASEEALGAWLKPLSGCCLRFEQGVMKTGAIRRASVRFVSSLGDGMHFVSLTDDGMVRVYDFAYLGAELVLRDNTREIDFIAVAQQRDVNGSPIIYSVDRVGAVCWSRISFDATGRAFESSKGFVGDLNGRPSQLLLSQHGQVVAAGFTDRKFCIWEPARDNSGSFVLQVRFPLRSADGVVDDPVKNAVVSGSGDFVAASTRSGGLYFWKKGKEIAERVAILKSRISKDRGALIKFMFLSKNEANLIILIECPSSYEIWDTVTGDRRSPRVELPKLCSIRCAGRGCGAEFEDLLLVGGYDRHARETFVVEYSIGFRLEIARTCRLFSQPSALCSADFSGGTGQSSAIVGSADGRVLLLGADWFNAGMRLEQRESGTRAEEVLCQSSFPVLHELGAFGIMPDAGRVVAGHDDGRLSLWSAEDGTFERMINNGRKMDRINCIDISADESFAITGHNSGTVLVWKTSTWNVRCTLESQSKKIVCVSVLANPNRVAAVDEDGIWFVWDAEKIGVALAVIETGLRKRDDGSRAFVNSDGRHLIWSTIGPYMKGAKSRHWMARLIDTVDGRVIFESDELHKEWNAPCVWAESHISQIGAIRSWKQATVTSDFFCDLRSLIEGSGRCWEISCGGSSRLQCALRSAGGKLSGRAWIDLDSRVGLIAAQWQPDLGEGGRRRAVVVCKLVQKRVPAILHFITPQM